MGPQSGQPKRTAKADSQSGQQGSVAESGAVARGEGAISQNSGSDSVTTARAPAAVEPALALPAKRPGGWKCAWRAGGRCCHCLSVCVYTVSYSCCRGRAGLAAAAERPPSSQSILHRRVQYATQAAM
jgi:hypothetical protein